jgi:hypothetical protein
MRAMTNRDIATGNQSTTENHTYSTTGPSSTWQIKNEVPDPPAPTCYVRALLATCTDDQIAAVLEETALVHDWIVIDNNTATLSNGTTGNSDGTPSEDRPSSSSGGTSAPTSTGDRVELQVQLSSAALVLAIAVAVVL